MFKKFITGLLIAFIAVICNLNVLAAGNISNIWCVSNERDLKSAVEKVDNYDCIRMTDNIELRGNLYVGKSVVLDLGGHTLYLSDTNSCIVTGDKVFSHQRAYDVELPGYYEDKDEIIYIPGTKRISRDSSGDIIVSEMPKKGVVNRKVWHPGVKNTYYKDVYKYCDNIEVILQNGTIRHIDGLPGRDGVNDTWSDYDGLDGETPSEVFRVISGSLKLYDVDVYGGYGGNGGNGASQKLVHIPFGGGDAGNGGNGGNGGDIINLTRKKCSVYLYGRTLLVPGQGGKGGQRGSKNGDYWVYSGFRGKDGKAGKSGVNINKSWKGWGSIFSSEEQISDAK